jgi:hypothetical protein
VNARRQAAGTQLGLALGQPFLRGRAQLGGDFVQFGGLAKPGLECRTGAQSPKNASVTRFKESVLRDRLRGWGRRTRTQK